MYKAVEGFEEIVASIQLEDGSFVNPASITEEVANWMIENGWGDYIEQV